MTSTLTKKHFIELLACSNPTCTLKATLLDQSIEELPVLECPACRTLYPITDGIPLLYHPPTEYVNRTYQSCLATAEYLHNFKLRVGDSDPYHRFADIWLTRMNKYVEDMRAVQQALGKSDGQQTVSPTDEFKAEYSKLEMKEEYLKSAYGIFLSPTAGNREGFYATILSAGKTLPRDALILDIGCGIGRTVLDYSLLCPDGQVVGFDYVYGTLQLAKQVLTTAKTTSVLIKVDFARHDVWELPGFQRPNITLVAGAAERLPFREDAFDCILGNYIFSIIDDYRAALRNAIKLLKPGGILITTNGFSWEDLREPERRHTPDDMKEVLESEGLDIELEFDFANLNTANPRYFHMRNTRLILGRRRI